MTSDGEKQVIPMTNTEKVAYIKGMMNGMNFEADSPEKKLLVAIVDALESIADSLYAVEEDTEYLSEYIEEVDSDLGDVEAEVFGYDDDDDFDDDYDDEEEFYEIECPSCGKKFCISEDMLDLDSIDCPKCGEKIELDLECCDCSECDCGCDEE